MLLATSLVKLMTWWTAGFLKELGGFHWMQVLIRLIVTAVVVGAVPAMLVQLGASVAALLVMPALACLIVLVGIGTWYACLRLLAQLGWSGPWLLLPTGGALSAPVLTWVVESQPPIIDLQLALVSAAACGLVAASLSRAFNWDPGLSPKLGTIRSAPSSVYNRKGP